MDKFWEVLKGPATVFSILIALWIAKSILGFDVSEIGPEGIKVRKMENKIDLTSTEVTKMRDEINKIKNIEETMSFLAQQSENYKKELEKKVRELEEKNFRDTQLVSDEQAQFAKPIEKKNKTLLKDKIGYMWIGNYSNGKWDDTRLRKLDGSTISYDPEKIELNSEFTTIGNIYLREQKPEDNLRYYRDINALGIIPKGTKITALEKPIKYVRWIKKQYWMKVKVNE